MRRFVTLQCNQYDHMIIALSIGAWISSAVITCASSTKQIKINSHHSIINASSYKGKKEKENPQDS